jgi:hypothetical protein
MVFSLWQGHTFCMTLEEAEAKLVKRRFSLSITLNKKYNNNNNFFIIFFCFWSGHLGSHESFFSHTLHLTCVLVCVWQWITRKNKNLSPFVTSTLILIFIVWNSQREIHVTSKLKLSVTISHVHRVKTKKKNHLSKIMKNNRRNVSCLPIPPYFSSHQISVTPQWLLW